MQISTLQAPDAAAAPVTLQEAPPPQRGTAGCRLLDRRRSRW